MAGAFLAGLAGDVVTSSLGSLVGAGANAINQKVEYDFNRQLQEASFRHDKDMLKAQVAATAGLQQAMIDIKREALTAGGFSPADAARGAVRAPMTQILDWNGSRYWAPNSMKTTGYSGTFASQGIKSSPHLSNQIPSSVKSTKPLPSISSSSSVYSSPSTAPSQSTQSTTLSAGTGSSRSNTVSTKTSTLSRTSDWVRGQNEMLGPFMSGALQTAYVTPPSSRASSQGTVSTVPKAVLDSWTPMFNTHRQPLFAHLRRRGESQI
ncbi:VP2 [Norovirus GII/Hu/JP/2007/GII.P7_GII.14/Fukuoka/KK282]|uniref:VP2 n=1 Tax=Norovirus GII/Hu/JP/2007/GII.P7_GII.14/Fukuoka/KK282 TaxID=1529920 RepID=A0A076JGT4_NORV|nr:VP2 [Norovirus GII/Hu/JP/2007/GII.P7_GII.14/Fukuoka/KK282]